MHWQTHAMSGWCLGNLAGFEARDRLLCMLAALVPDTDGLSKLGGMESYWKHHHVWGHSLVFGVAATAAMLTLAKDKLKGGAFFLLLFHLHLVMDHYGSGEGWGHTYFWPFSDAVTRNPESWPFYSWQNFAIAAAFLSWTVAIAVRNGVTPLEIPMPDLNRQLVELLRRRMRRRNPAEVDPAS